MQANQVHGLTLREIGGGFPKHHRAPSIRLASYAVAKPATMVQKMQNIKKLRGHRDAVYCAIFDRLGRYVITGSDDRLVKVWSMETGLCLASCRGHEGDITDLAVSSNNALVASASNDYSIRVWRLPDGLPISVLRGHTGAVTAIAFTPKTSSVYQLLSSSDDGTCRIWDARSSQCVPRVYSPRPKDNVSVRSSGTVATNIQSSSNTSHSHQILCCAYNANGTVFVTGSSDTIARVWNACKFSPDHPDELNHEIDTLSGHENDVNYVQFSGCAVASRSSTSDSFGEDCIPKFRNSWFSHDNIVTCSRDGSAIIWTPKPRKSSHGKHGRSWVKAYHLKVPPPPMPPQPPRGGPRQRFRPTPRGVNMIVWSLDNRFVLAAIMDCRICVWNASDGSLVHSLTGHAQSTYVLDVHPFNPRIAMSAGYDGKTILWDIWEGIPIRTYDIGRFKLVDGKFSQDGTSIVLSDDVGQIYLLNTGQGESQKDAKYDQFFLGDYRPLIQDVQGNVLDQETQLTPYRRNMQDLLCDASMLPYPEPYQSMYQRRRLGALGTEWRPPSIKFSVGTDPGLGLGYQVLPVADLDIIAEPLPEFVDTLFWEPDNGILNDETDSEYNMNEELSTEGEHECLRDGSSSGSVCSEEQKMRRSRKDSLRRSKRKISVSEVEVASSGRRLRKKVKDEDVGTSCRSLRTRKSRNGKKATTKRKSTKPKSLRPHRGAELPEIVHLHSDISSDDEDEASSEDDSLETESPECSSSDQRISSDDKMPSKQRSYPTVGAIDVPPRSTEPPINGENKRRLVLKLKIRDASKVEPSKDTAVQCGDQADKPCSSQACEEIIEDNVVNRRLKEPGSSYTDEIGMELFGECNKIEHMVNDKEPKNDLNEHVNREPSAGPDIQSLALADSLMDEAQTNLGQLEASTLLAGNGPGDLVCSSGAAKTSSLFHLSLSPNHQLQKIGVAPGANKPTTADDNPEVNLKPRVKPNIIKIKSKKMSKESQARSEFNLPTDAYRVDESTSKIFSHLEQNQVPETGNGPDRFSQNLHWGVLTDDTVGKNKSHGSRSSLRSSRDICESASNACNDHNETGSEFPHVATDAARRKRSLRFTAMSRDTALGKDDLKIRESRIAVGSSINTGKLTKKATGSPPLGWTSSNAFCRLSRDSKEGSSRDENVFSSGMSLNEAVKKLNWLLLSEHEEGYRYIPQLGDEVVYFRQGHQEYIEYSDSSEPGPWTKNAAAVQAVEICLVKHLSYATLPGSGDSCCKVTLQFIDTSSPVSGHKFKLTLPELVNFPDFLIERSRYEAAMERNWSYRDKCLVWWRDESEQGGRWWDGQVVSVKAKSEQFPDSPWERCGVLYEGEVEPHPHSPWELHDVDSSWEQPQVDLESRNRVLSSVTELLQSASRNQDKYGILKLKHVAVKLDFMNRFPVPLSPDIIQLRLENNYYRSLKAMKHDFSVMIANGEAYFSKNRELSVKMKHLSEWFTKKLSNL
ncbi:PH-interacting protein isoform X2 [Capsicum annuum]|nr:PH-interacting protein isoform X2 [Capsicum annuum]